VAEQEASITSLLCTLLISDARVLQQAWRTPFHKPQPWPEWRHEVYVAYHPWAARYPDHVFDTAWRAFSTPSHGNSGYLIKSLFALVDDYLELRHGEIYVKRDRFSAWQQSLISRISFLPVRAAAIIRFSSELWWGTPDHYDQISGIKNGGAPWANECVQMLRPYDLAIDDYVSREGLHETHLHLNGTTHAEVCWLRALNEPNAETKDFNKAWTDHKKKRQVRELVALINPSLTPAELNKQLRVAKTLRAWLIAAATNTVTPQALLPVSCAKICDSPEDSLAPDPLGLALNLSKSAIIANEAKWQYLLIQRLTHSPSVQLERMFHCYLLLQNQYYRLLVQSESHYGFDQFQKFTLTELREPAEDDYLHRFQAIHGHRLPTSRVKYLEGRFAPKKSVDELSQLLYKILNGYRKYLTQATSTHQAPPPFGANLAWVLSELEKILLSKQVSDRSVHRLALVVHFIKEPWSPSRSAPYRFHALEHKLRQNTGALLSTLKLWPRLSMWIRGIDGAANELHAPPDCFASIFRVCRRAGITHCSFHAGEDFPHLLSGIRYIFDTLELLNMREGDRLGHGTAMGIHPSLWIDRMPQRISINRGDWLLSVLAGWILLRNIPECASATEKLRLEVEQTACFIFGKNISPAELERAMALRHLSAHEVSRMMSAESEFSTIEPLNDIWQAEANLVYLAHKEDKSAVELLWQWQSDQRLWERSESLTQKDAAFLDEASYIKLQQALMLRVKARGVVIETLPSSNVRISQYIGFHEHHALRWMKVAPHAIDGDPEIMVALGSDDPGIFASDIESEFHHLFAAMRNLGLSESDALQKLAVINERGRIYRFHDRRIQ